MSYRKTMSKDGKERVSFTLSYRLTLEELSTFVTARGADLDGWCKWDGSDVNKAAVRKTLSSKSKAMDLAKDAIDRHGTEIPSYRIGDEHLEDLRAVVLARLEELFN